MGKELTEKDINEAIKKCKWRKKFSGVYICTGDVIPCFHNIESGKCSMLKNMFMTEEYK